MTGAVLLHLVTYAAVAAFGLAVAYRFIKISTMPMHLRWELYPVAHEASKAKHGGSILEELNWWTKEREVSFIGELKVMIPEMTLLVALFEHNRKVWYRSFPFHMGLYILAGTIGLIFLGALMELFGIYVGPDPTEGIVLGTAVYYLTQLGMVVGLGLGTLGALGLLVLRLFDEDMKGYTSAAAIFNLLFFLAAFGLAWVTLITVDTSLAMTRSYVQSLVTLNLTASAGSPILAAEIAVGVLLIAYIPMTHMSHFFVKWFTYHKIRWDDEPNMVGSDIEKKVIEQVQYPVTWAGAHLKADGKKNWVDIATEEMD